MRLHSQQAVLSGRLAGINGVSRLAARHAFATGEADVSQLSGAASLLGAPGSDVATVPPLPIPAWTGLAHEARRLGVQLSPAAVAQFACYRDLLIEGSRRMNLTAVRDPVEIERRLFLGALAIIPELDRVLTMRDRAGANVRLIDIGSGAGFPGLALKIARPELDITLVDATAKKVAFLEDVIAELGLTQARAMHARAEALGQDTAFRGRFTLATARAVATLPVLLEFVMPLLELGGVAFLPKGLAIEEELRAGRNAAAELGAEIVSAAPLPVAGTRLVVARKTGLTPAVYPRRIGVPAQHPLGDRA